MVWWYDMVNSGSALITNLAKWLVDWIVDKLPDYLPASQVSRYILYTVLVSGVCWLLFGFIFQTKEKDD